MMEKVEVIEEVVIYWINLLKNNLFHFIGFGQLSEREMLKKALEVSAMDFIKGRFSDDEYE